MVKKKYQKYAQFDFWFQTHACTSSRIHFCVLHLNAPHSAWHKRHTGVNIQQWFAVLGAVGRALRKKLVDIAECTDFCFAQSLLFFSVRVFSSLAMCGYHNVFALNVCSIQFLQRFYFFILLLSHSAFSPSLPCTHARLGSVGVWRMTHLLHTSSLLGHIWASRKSIFLV